MPRRKDPPPIIEWVIDHTAQPVRLEDVLDAFNAFIDALPDDPDALFVSTNDHTFSAGSYAFSRVHNQVVRVWSRRGKTVRVTLDLFEESELQTDRVKESDLMTWCEFLTWAPRQPWYVPFQGSGERALLEHFARLLRPRG